MDWLSGQSQPLAGAQGHVGMSRACPDPRVEIPCEAGAGRHGGHTRCLSISTAALEAGGTATPILQGRRMTMRLLRSWVPSPGVLSQLRQLQQRHLCECRAWRQDCMVRGASCPPLLLKPGQKAGLATGGGGDQQVEDLSPEISVSLLLSLPFRVRNQ